MSDDDSPTTRRFLFPVVVLIWIADKVASFGLGFLVVAIIWIPFWLVGDVNFGLSWRIAGIVLGMFIVGLWEGCDLPLMWIAYLLPGYRK